MPDNNLKMAKSTPIKSAESGVGLICVVVNMKEKKRLAQSERNNLISARDRGILSPTL
jgi:hypothetical protein